MRRNVLNNLMWIFDDMFKKLLINIYCLNNSLSWFGDLEFCYAKQKHGICI